MAWLCIGSATGVEVKQGTNTMGHYNYLVEPYCEKCSSPGRDSQQCILLCMSAESYVYGFNRLFSLGKYIRYDRMHDDLLSKHIRYLKNGYRQYSEPLGSALYQFVKTKFPALLKADYVIPMPAHENAINRRSFNQTELFSDEYCIYSEQESLHCMDKVKDSEFAKNKIRLERRYELVKGMFQLKSKSFEKVIKDKYFLLLDDVATCCAQASECSQILRNHGANKVDVLTLGRTELDGTTG